MHAQAMPEESCIEMKCAYGVHLQYVHTGKPNHNAYI